MAPNFWSCSTNIAPVVKDKDPQRVYSANDYMAHLTMMHIFLQSLAIVTAMNAHKISGHDLSARNKIQISPNSDVSYGGRYPHTSRSTNETTTNDNDVHCGPLYGRNLETSSCEDAIAHIPNTDKRINLDGLNIFSSCKPLPASISSSTYDVEHWVVNSTSVFSRPSN